MNKFQLKFPVKPFHVNQYFGNPDPKYKELGLPAHNGIDFYAVHGAPIYACHDGLAYYEIDDKGGHGVVITTEKDDFEYKGKPVRFKSIYWHLVDPKKEPKYKSPVYGYTPAKPLQIKQGQLIGYADSTGFSDGDHLHFGLKPGYFKRTVWVNVEQDNGFFGAIDPKPYFIDWPFQFTRDLDVGMSGPDVLELQKFLNKSAFVISMSGPGSPGKETDYFGPLTQTAVKKMQKSYGIWPQLGYFGSKTRKTVNSILLLPLNI